MSRRPVRVSERTRNLEFDSMFIFKNGKVTLDTDESLSTNSAGQIIINPSSPIVNMNIIGSGANGLPLLRFGVSGGDNIVRIQTSTDSGVTWIDTDTVIFAP
jgi:hypothetical protein